MNDNNYRNGCERGHENPIVMRAHQHGLRVTLSAMTTLVGVCYSIMGIYYVHSYHMMLVHKYLLYILQSVGYLARPFINAT